MGTVIARLDSKEIKMDNADLWLNVWPMRNGMERVVDVLMDLLDLEISVNNALLDLCLIALRQIVFVRIPIKYLFLKNLAAFLVLKIHLQIKI